MFRIIIENTHTHELSICVNNKQSIQIKGVGCIQEFARKKIHCFIHGINVYFSSYKTCKSGIYCQEEGQWIPMFNNIIIIMH